MCSPSQRRRRSVARKVHPRESPGPPTKSGQQRREIRGNAGRRAHALRLAASLCLLLAIFIDSIKTVISHRDVVVVVVARKSLCAAQEQRRRRGSECARFIQVHVTAPAALSDLAHPQQMCQRPLCEISLGSTYPTRTIPGATPEP